jgi:NADH-quinone oxidoreductase subunit L
VVGGFFNIDSHIPVVNFFAPLAPLFGGELALHHWLKPVTVGAENVWRAQLGELIEPHHAWWPILLAIGIGIGGLALALLLLKPTALGDAEREPAYTGTAGKLLFNKWYVDEIYEATVVRPVVALSRGFASFFDRGVIDGVVDGAGRAAQSVGLVIGRLQTGLVNTYAFVILVGVLAVLGTVVARSMGAL